MKVHDVSITNLFSSAESERGQSPSKPVVAVKPTVIKSPKKKAANVQNGEDSRESGNVYCNVGSAAATPPSSSTHSQPSPGQSGNRSVPPQTSNPDVEENGSSLADDRHVYGNDDDNMYATFKATKPQLDTVQQYLVDRLASGTLKQEFSASINVYRITRITRLIR